jgi:hypothetical protein
VSGKDFGHRPILQLASEGPVCARCRTWRRNVWIDDFEMPRRGRRYPVPVPWPCTSAVVLDIATHPDTDRPAREGDTTP